MKTRAWLVLTLAVGVCSVPLVGCKAAPAPTPGPAASPGQPTAPAAPPAATSEALEPAPEATPLPKGIAPLIAAFTGDLEAMKKRRVIRVLTVQSPLFYFVDRGREAGLTYEAIKNFETYLNQQAKTRVGQSIYVVAVPVSRDQLIPLLLKGEGDIAAAALTITPERKKLVDFSQPTATGVQEVLVTGPDAPPVASLDELSGKEVFVRPSSAYAEHIRRLNERFAKQGKPPLKVTPASEMLEDGDILEMVSAGLAPATVVDSYVADLYTQVFPNLRKNSDIASAPQEIAWAFRKKSPQLAQAVNAFVKTNKQGSLAGNVLINKYLKTTKWVKNARSDEDRKRFEAMVQLFKKYSDKYDFDYLLMAAQAYQESGLDQSKRSPVGAIGVMQVMPTTARDKAVGIHDIEKLESNIHAGIKYNRWMVDNFFNEAQITPLNKSLFAFASYNAGPGAMKAMRKKAVAQGLDPNKWFNNVELVAARQIGRETVTYVSNIYKYYLAYQMMAHRTEDRDAARSSAGVPRKKR